MPMMPIFPAHAAIPRLSPREEEAQARYAKLKSALTGRDGRSTKPVQQAQMAIIGPPSKGEDPKSFRGSFGKLLDEGKKGIKTAIKAAAGGALGAAAGAAAGAGGAAAGGASAVSSTAGIAGAAPASAAVLSPATITAGLGPNLASMQAAVGAPVGGSSMLGAATAAFMEPIKAEVSGLKSGFSNFKQNFGTGQEGLQGLEAIEKLSGVSKDSLIPDITKKLFDEKLKQDRQKEEEERRRLRGY